MSAYAALLSLKQTLTSSQRRKLIIFKKIDRSIYCLVVLLLNFLDNTSTEIPELETEMRVAAYKAVDRIDDQILNRTFSMKMKLNLPVSELAIFLLIYYNIIMLIKFMSAPIRYLIILIISVGIAGVNAALIDPDMREVVYDFSNLVIQTRAIRRDSHNWANATLESLRSDIDSVLSSLNKLVGFASHYRAHLESLRETVSSLINFLGHSSANNNVTELQLQAIGDAAYKSGKFLRKNPDYLLLLGKFVIAKGIFILSIPLCSFRIDDVLGMVNVSATFVYLLYRYYCMTAKYKRFLQVIDDFRDVIKIKDAGGSQSELPAATSRPDLGGSGRTHVVVGLGNDLIHIKALMFQDCSNRRIISIVGMGGIGKTTLASQVYNDPDIFHHFDVRAWVKVSQDYSLRHVLLSLLDSAKMLTQEMQGHDDQILAVDLHQILTGRRYLIVMDDVWDTQIWDFMSGHFPENHNGSCLLLTSRISKVASYPDSSSALHQMQCLNEDDSWYLLHEIVFGAEGYPIELESIGREIARCCRGLPLAISAVGGLIYKDNQIEIWKKVADKIKHSQSSEIIEQCLEILGLSYNHLPHSLRPLFLYMGVFPGNCEIPVDRLINLWIAEGFLVPHTSTNLEELGELRLQNLIDRNLISVGKSSCTGKIKTCTIHDLLRDVCVKIAEEENFLHVVELEGHGTRGRLNETTRRRSIHPDALHDDARNDLTSSYHSLHSFLCTARKPITDCKIGVYLDFMYLRVLDVLAIHFNEFPHQIIKLWFLRYLALHYDGPFPASISKLKNLETIVHHHCLFGKYPLYHMVIWSMPNLRHLYVKPGYELSQFVRGPNSLVHLQTLVGAINMRWSQSMIRIIPNLKKLVISYDVSSSVEWSLYQLECLVELHQLESLKITMVSAISHDPPKLVFPQKLKKLSLSGCGIPWAEMAGIGELLNLEALKLRREAFRGPSWKTVEGGFPQLTFLLLEEMSFASWETDAAHFPRLKHLVIMSCGSLKMFPEELGDISTFEMFKLINCHPYLVKFARKVQKEQESGGNLLKLHILSRGSDGQQQESIDDSDAEEDSEETAEKDIGND